MKKINKKIEKVVASTLAVSVLNVSCSPYYQDEDALYKKDNYSGNDLGRIAIPISIGLNSEEARYLAFLQKLSSDIIENPEVAKEFSKNPDSFVKAYGYNEKVTLDEGMLKLILALGDDDINKAISLNDTKAFYELCKEKNLFSVDSKLIGLVNNEEIRKKLNDLGLNLGEGGEQISQPPKAFLVPIVAIVVAVAVVVVAVYAATHNSFTVTSKMNSEMERLSESNPVLNIWALKDKKDKTHIVVNELIENQINEAIDLIKKEKPSFFKNNSEEEFRALIKLNLN